ncbi:DUF2971 domain-containing protein [Acidobacteriota bacterium]
MRNSNYLNLSEDDLKKPIYRVMPVFRLLELFKRKYNTLVKPRLWDDPFENFILQGHGKLSDGKLVSFGMRDSLYGQCWTMNKDSDAMWRIYSPDKNGVKIRTTVRKLFNSLYSRILINERDVNCFIGMVEYLTPRRINDFLEQVNITDSTGAGIAKTLLVKRQAFSHEREVRLIYIADEHKAQHTIFQYNIDPSDLIREIVFDPRMNEYLCEIFESSFRKEGFQGKIFQSDLYKGPENIIINI